MINQKLPEQIQNVRYAHTFIAILNDSSEEQNYVHLYLMESSDPETALQFILDSDTGLQETLEELDYSGLEYISTSEIPISHLPGYLPSYYKVTESSIW